MTRPIETQYAALNERRLHFGRMFWQNIAFHISALIAIAFWVSNFKPTQTFLSTTALLAGLATGLMALIAYRLQRLEVQYEIHLRAIEDYWIAAEEGGIQRPDVSGRFSSRLVVVSALALSGFSLGLFGLVGLLGGRLQ